MRFTEQSSLFTFLNKVTRALISFELLDPFILGSSLNVFEKKFLPESVVLSVVILPKSSLFLLLFNELCSSSFPHVEKIIEDYRYLSSLDQRQIARNFFCLRHSQCNPYLILEIKGFVCFIIGRFYPTIVLAGTSGSGSKRNTHKGPKH